MGFFVLAVLLVLKFTLYVGLCRFGLAHDERQSPRLGEAVFLTLLKYAVGTVSLLIAVVAARFGSGFGSWLGPFFLLPLDWLEWGVVERFLVQSVAPGRESRPMGLLVGLTPWSRRWRAMAVLTSAGSTVVVVRFAVSLLPRF